ncbi:Protein of unknown function [Pyronema omphalodes CBS 100304]|uniref:Uncharacterized protein n=1 Tax=Pyronema omphalodes (strain CBS 100304) TaxID=1076935 RepID=U4L3R0_PYROM|nr:Protein of unknown function [Pyronema omphalodes CBS 100304]
MSYQHTQAAASIGRSQSHNNRRQSDTLETSALFEAVDDLVRKIDTLIRSYDASYWPQETLANGYWGAVADGKDGDLARILEAIVKMLEDRLEEMNRLNAFGSLLEHKLNSGRLGSLMTTMIRGCGGGLDWVREKRLSQEIPGQVVCALFGKWYENLWKDGDAKSIDAVGLEILLQNLAKFKGFIDDMFYFWNRDEGILSLTEFQYLPKRDLKPEQGHSGVQSPALGIDPRAFVRRMFEIFDACIEKSEPNYRSAGRLRTISNIWQDLRLNHPSLLLNHAKKLKTILAAIKHSLNESLDRTELPFVYAEQLFGKWLLEYLKRPEKVNDDSWLDMHAAIKYLDKFAKVMSTVDLGRKEERGWRLGTKIWINDNLWDETNVQAVVTEVLQDRPVQVMQNVFPQFTLRVIILIIIWIFAAAYFT